MKAGLSKIFVSILLLGLSACGKDDNPSSDSGKIELGTRVEVYRQTVNTQGGLLTVPATGSPVDELTIEIKENTYPESKEFVVGYYPIKSHAFGTNFKPVTPVIEVINGGDYAGKVMYLSMDISKTEHEKLAPFYYDRITGKLESIPIIGYKDGKLTIALRHFSLIVVGSFEKELFALGGFYETYFDPSVNGWSFTNSGSWSSIGNCAGMCIGAAYYYQNRSSAILLKDHFDNHGYWFQTPSLETDDADGIRFASALQYLYDKTWNGAYSELFEQNFNSSDEDNFWSMVYSIFMNKDPQLICVGKAVNTEFGHMVLATSYEFIGDEVHFQIYDPNYPNQLNVLKYNLQSNTFQPYISAENTQAILENRYYEFHQIVHIPLSTVVSGKEVDALFLKTADHTIASDIFPEYEIYAVPTVSGYDDIKLSDATKGIINVLPFNEFTLALKVNPPYVVDSFGIISHFQNPETKEWEIQDPVSLINLTMPGNHLLGVHVNANRFNIPKIWTDFQYYKIEYQNIWIEADPQDAQKNENIAFRLRSNGKIPDGARIVWDFGNGQKKTVYNDTLTHFSYPAIGSYTVKADVFDVITNKEFGKTSIQIKVSDHKYERLDAIIQGKNVNDKPFQYDDGHTESTISYSNVPAFYDLPKLKWTDLRFQAEFDYGDTTNFSREQISGVMSTDLKTIISLHLSYSYETDELIYESDVVMENLSVKESNKDQLIVDIQGISTKSHIIQLRSVYKEKLPNGTIVIKSSLSNVDYDKARIFLHFTND